MAKNPAKDKKVLRKGGWSAEEDEKLIAYISRYGIWNWNEIPKHAGLSRTGKSCRLRWLNYLRPGIKRGNITREEEEIIVKLHSILGNRWAAIAAKLPQRTDNEIKNYWKTRIQRRNREFCSKIEPPAESEDKYHAAEVKPQKNNVSETDSPFPNSLSQLPKMEESPDSTTYDHLPLFSSSQAVPIERVEAAEDHHVGSSETYNEIVHTLAMEGSEKEAYSLLELYDSSYVPSYDFWGSSFI